MRRFSCILAALLLLASCSTTKLLSEGRFRLAENEINIVSEDKLSSSEFTPYLKQQANTSLIFGWNPAINIYNWSNGSGKGINALWQAIGQAPVVFDESLVAQSRDNILVHLENLGYYNASVESDVQYKDRLAKVAYTIRTGERKRIDKIVYDVPAGQFAEDFYADTVNVSVRPGDYLNDDILEQESVRGAEHFRRLGYYSFNKNHYFFEADTLGDSNILYYRIKEYTRNEPESASEPLRKYYFNDVSISHDADIKIKPSLITKLNQILPGDIYNEDVVNTSYYRLASLNVFGAVNVETEAVDSNLVNCRMQLSGANMLGFKANAEMSSNSSGLFGISPQLTFFHKNLFGGGERLNLGFTGNWQSRPGTAVSSLEVGVSAGLSLPNLWLLDPQKSKNRYIPRTEINASFNYQNRPEYRRNVASFSYGYSGRFGEKLYYQIYPLKFSLVNLHELSEDFYDMLINNPYLWDSFKDQTDLGLGAQLYYTSDNSIVPKSSYHFARLNFDSSGNLISLFNKQLPVSSQGSERLFMGLPYQQYLRAELSLGKTFSLDVDNNHAIAMRLHAGVGHAYGNSNALPFEKQFYAGGASSMRGWQMRTLGPGADQMEDIFLIPSQTGDVKFEFDMEYRFKMFWKLEGALFAEAGNVWILDDIKDHFDPQTIAADWGLGVRLNLDFILIRVDAGFKLHDPSRQEGSKWLTPHQWFSDNGAAIHFGVGYPF